MIDRTTGPAGSWRSIFTADLLTRQSVRLGSCRLGHDGTAYWIEGRPAEGGRNVLVKRTPGGANVDITPAPFNVRTSVHEYGGGAFEVGHDTIYFVDLPSQRIHGIRSGQPARPLTPAGSRWRFADLVIDHARERLLCVAEWHPGGENEDIAAVKNCVVGIPLSSGEIEILIDGRDFYACPRLSPDGRTLAWLTWDHPRMPWDAAALWTARLDDAGKPMEPKPIAGDGGASVVQPGFGPDGDLVFAFEPGGFWNLHTVTGDNGEIRPLAPSDAEFALPLWQLGMSTWGFLDRRRIAAACTRNGLWSIVVIDCETGTVQPVATTLSAISHLDARAGKILVVGGSATRFSSVIELDPDARSEQVLCTSADFPGLDTDGWLSRPQAMTFPTGDGDQAHAFFYPPCNPDHALPAGEAPPLLVLVHGGPTSATTNLLSPALQFWTSRGFAVADVNYRGSTGHGRAYRDRLQGQWGVHDVDDCVAVARFLAETGRVDPRRMAIRGGSAGGFTVLAALTFHDTFTAGASHYGVSDLEALARDTHKFESRYLDGLVAPYPADADVYRRRSPIHSVDRLSRPVIFFQGLDDKVVPPNQAEMMADALRKKGIPVAHLTFAGEQHGFRKAETIRRVLEAELYFYGRVFGFQPHDQIDPVAIDNLDRQPASA